MLFTVAICTWNRSRLLARALRALGEIDAAGMEWEVLVVDNASTDDTAAVLRSGADWLPLRVVREPVVGLSHARNAAVSAARGAIVAWTDDDVLVARGWLKSYRDAVCRWTEMSFYGGPIVPAFEGDLPEWLTANWTLLSSAYAVRDFGPLPIMFDRTHVPYGANFAVRTDVLREHRFDGALGLKGDVRVGGEETTLLRQLIDVGHKGRWVPDARVEHVIPANRLTFDYIRRYYIGQGMTALMAAGTPGLPGRAPWLWQAAVDADRRYRAARRTHAPQEWIPTFVAACVARGRYLASRDPCATAHALAGLRNSQFPEA